MKARITANMTIFASGFRGSTSLAPEGKEPASVTVANFVRAESGHMIRANIEMLGVELGEFTQLHEPTTPDSQAVIRMNQNTVHSATVLDLTEPVTITLPEIGGRYMSMHVVNQDHCAFVESKPGAHELTEDEIGTRFAQVMVRTFYDAGDPDQIAEAHAARARIKISGGGDGPFEAPHWDPDDIAKARGTLSDLATLGFDSTYAFRREEDVRPIDHLVGAAAGGGVAAHGGV